MIDQFRWRKLESMKAKREATFFSTKIHIHDEFSTSFKKNCMLNFHDKNNITTFAVNYTQKKHDETTIQFPISLLCFISTTSSYIHLAFMSFSRKNEITKIAKISFRSLG